LVICEENTLFVSAYRAAIWKILNYIIKQEIPNTASQHGCIIKYWMYFSTVDTQITKINGEPFFFWYQLLVLPLEEIIPATTIVHEYVQTCLALERASHIRSCRIPAPFPGRNVVISWEIGRLFFFLFPYPERASQRLGAEVASFCTELSALAPSGLLDNKEATSSRMWCT